MSAIPRTVSSLYTAPVGLLGLIITSAVVRGVMRDSMSSSDGFQPFASSAR